MRPVPTKVNAVTTLDADEYNQVQNDIENAVSTTGQTLDGLNEFQLPEAIARYAATGGVFYQDSGVADAYVLLPLGSFTAPAIYLDGEESVFKIGNDSTGASTINRSGIGVKSLTLPDGSAISTEMVAGQYATTRFNEADDRVELLPGAASGGVALPTGYFTGFTKSNGADADHDYDFLGGSCRDSADAVNIVTGTLTKQFDASWVTGTGNGGLSSSLTPLTADTWYHIFAIVVGGVADIAADTDINAANLIADHSVTAYRHLWSFLTDGSDNIIPSILRGDVETWTNPPLDLDSGATRNADLTISTPLGYAVDARVRIFGERGGGGDSTMVMGPSDGATPDIGTIFRTSSTTAGWSGSIITDTSSQIFVHIGLTQLTGKVETAGWRYTREAM